MKEVIDIKIFPKRLGDAQEIVREGSGSASNSGHWYDRNSELEVYLNDKFIEGTSSRNWSFGYDVDKQDFGKPNETTVRIGDKLVTKSRKWGSGPEGRYGSKFDPFLVTEYIVVPNDYVFE